MTDHTADDGGAPGRSQRWRRTGFRVAAVLLGLLALPALEMLLWLFGWGDPQWADDPFVGFRATRPLFVRNDSEQRHETAANRLDFFRPESFSVTKSASEFRIFCLGGSTVQGRPFRTETSFTTWLEISLRAADPSRRWEVVNCGGISYASYRLVTILEEIFQYEPDLIILYTGHNEFLEDRTYDHIKRRPALLSAAVDTASRLRSVTLLRHLVHAAGERGSAPPENRPLLEEEVRALLDYKGGLEHYRWNEAWRQGVIEHFEFNVRRMVRMCEQRDVPVWLVDPVANLRDCPPFKSEHRADLTEDELHQWEAWRRRAKRLYTRDIGKAIGLLEQARDLDGQHAGLWFDLANCYERLGRMEEARRCYSQAKEFDVCPLRILGSMNQVIQRVSQDLEVPLIPVREAFVQRAEHGIPGNFLLVDHVHPSILGHQFIAELLLDRFIAEGVVRPESGYQAKRDELYRQHMDSLDDWYFLEGQKRLEALHLWAQGRSNQLPAAAESNAGPTTRDDTEQ